MKQHRLAKTVIKRITTNVLLGILSLEVSEIWSKVFFNNPHFGKKVSEFISRVNDYSRLSDWCLKTKIS
jgi:hypothetical protein